MVVVVVLPPKCKPVTSHTRQVKAVGTPEFGGLAIVIVVIVGIDMELFVGKNIGQLMIQLIKLLEPLILQCCVVLIQPQARINTQYIINVI